MTPLQAWALHGSARDFREGVSAFRNYRDLAYEYRVQFIEAANLRLRNPSPETLLPEPSSYDLQPGSPNNERCLDTELSPKALTVTGLGEPTTSSKSGQNQRFQETLHYPKHQKHPLESESQTATWKLGRPCNSHKWSVFSNIPRVLRAILEL